MHTTIICTFSVCSGECWVSDLRLSCKSSRPQDWCTYGSPMGHHALLGMFHLPCFGSLKSGTHFCVVHMPTMDTLWKGRLFLLQVKDHPVKDHGGETSGRVILSKPPEIEVCLNAKFCWEKSCVPMWSNFYQHLLIILSLHLFLKTLDRSC